MTTSREQSTDPTDVERADLDSTRESSEEAMREADKANGEPGALDDDTPENDLA